MVEASVVNKAVPTERVAAHIRCKKFRHSNSPQGFQFCQQESERRAQGSEVPAAPSTTPVMWSLTSGSCTLLKDGCLTTPNLPDDHDGSSCEVAIDPEWTGVLFVEYMYADWDTFHVDGEPVPGDEGQLSVHGMAPRSSLVWSPGSSWGTWKLCQVNALPPWRVTQGYCHIDREGCFVNADSCFAEWCSVEFRGDWAGSLNVVEAQFEFGDSYGVHENPISILTVNGQSHAVDIQRRRVTRRRARDGGCRKWIHMAENGLWLCMQQSEDTPHGICQVAWSLG